LCAAAPVMFLNVADVAICCGCDDHSDLQVEVVAASKAWTASPPEVYSYQPVHFHLEESCLDPLPYPEKSPMTAASPTSPGSCRVSSPKTPRTPSLVASALSARRQMEREVLVQLEVKEPGDLGLDFETADGFCIVSRVKPSSSAARWNETAETAEKIQKFDQLLAVDGSENVASPTSAASLQKQQGQVKLRLRRPQWRRVELAPKGQKLGLALTRRQETSSIWVRRVEVDGFVAQSGLRGQETLRVDDRIIAVNGVRDDVARMATELLAKSLTVEVCSYSERPLQDVSEQSKP